MSQPLLLEMKNIHKKFPGVYALKGINFTLYPGEVHALLGENGAGKSTLIKILGGIYAKDQGEIFIEEKPVQITDVTQARAAGISIIHQELVLVPYLSVAENIFLGREPRQKNGLVDFSLICSETQRILNEFGLALRPEAKIAELTIAQQQMVEIVKAISTNAKIIVMDEPTSSIADKEVDSLFENIRRLTQKGIGIIYISHRMSELQQIADRVTVMRDGEYIGTCAVKDTDNEKLIAMMVGRTMTNYYTRTYNECTETVLRVDKLCSNKVHDVSFELKRGEILGFAGLIGAGRSETMKALFGIDKITSGTVELMGSKIEVKSTQQMIEAGISLVPEDRKNEGIFPTQSVQFNLTLKVLKEFIKGVLVDSPTEMNITETYMQELSIKAPNAATAIGSLSGGNQQKVVISSWLATHPKVLILDEPTRGIDVGAKSEIYIIMNELAKQGVSIIMVSSELPEILNMSDRIAVMCDGTITTILSHSEATQEKIMQYAVKM
ncbi:sugar ABC transporter ATP-binding protein [Acetanaerobacterium elongatum]|uniref:Monosaccharide ABC transporter ATP-binding protein, CUT2 family n=1 Tax=Acetanaerobacterium elongatum TaxID=258515 RepID=A0A1G9USV2_9FIRM|nr:sugar ABC transporter ATP-binding protein [Acetanaerobacterium elongatum]SDM62974.1 monosaccharide ABC transporter ATP-binding protein, CUT2 family [Acetanaerobacterium elongatum]